MFRFSALLLLCVLAVSGCGQQEKLLNIYCNETFWYAMQEESLAFGKIYGFDIVLYPIRAGRMPEPDTHAVVIEAENRSRSTWIPSTWQSMPSETMPIEESTGRAAPSTQFNPDIEHQIMRIAETHIGELFLTDSPKHFEKVRNSALAASESLVCYLTLTMLVPKENPHQFRSIKDVLAVNRTLGIMHPSFDGLGEASWQVLSRIIPGGESAIPLDLVQIYERQYDLLEALELGEIDAALVWNATSQTSFLLLKYGEEYNYMYEIVIRDAERRKDKERLKFILQEMYQDLIEANTFAEEVSLVDNPGERHVVAIYLVSLSSASNFGFSKRFTDFMRSNHGRSILHRYGFVTE